MNETPIYEFPSYSTYSFELQKTTIFKYGIVDFVDETLGKMDIRYNYNPSENGKYIKKDVLINFGSWGLGGGVRVMPRVGDTVIMGVNPYGDVVHLGTVGFKYEKLVDNPADVSTAFKDTSVNIRQGEFHLQATKFPGSKKELPFKRGSIYGDNLGNLELKDGNFTVVRMDAPEKELYSDINTFRIKNYKLRLSQGVVKREQVQVDGSTSMVPRTFFGVPATAAIPAISEFRMKVGQEISPIDGSDFGDPTVEITVAEQVLDDNAIPKFDKAIKDLQTYIKYKNGLEISINSNGVINIAGGSQLIPPKKRSSRENDKTSLPIGLSIVDLNHPDQALRGVTNAVQMVTLSGMIYSPVGPCFFIPSGNVTLDTTIVEGSNALFVGDSV